MRTFERRVDRRAGRAAAAVLAMVAAGAPAGAVTVQTFDGGGTAYQLGQHLEAPPAAVMAGGPRGSFLRLAFDTATPPNLNTVDFERTDPGPACAIHAEFDFRITPGSGRADGLGLALLDTGLFGPAGVVAPAPPHFVAEEPDFARSLGIGFDVYRSLDLGDPDDNHVSIHFDGTRVAQIDAGSVDLGGGEWIHAEIDLDAAAGTVSVALTPAGGSAVLLVTDLPVPGLSPYEARVHFGARSGGLAADHDLDQIEVSYAACPPERVGAWSEVMEWPLVAIHTHLLPTGEVMFWDRHDVLDGAAAARAQETAAPEGAPQPAMAPIVPRLWNPQTGAMRLAAAPPFDLFCSGHTHLADGRLFVAGGHVVDAVGLPDAAIYDPLADSWTDLPDMSAGRWYPTATLLADGDVLVVSGEITPGVFNEVPEVWEVDAGQWRPLADARRRLPLYPFMLLAPDGRVLAAGPQTGTRMIHTAGAGSETFVDANDAGDRNYGSAVVLADGRAMLIGGGIEPTASVELLDPEAAAPSWTPAAPMAFARRQLDATLLPDGTVLVTGGTGAVGFNNATGSVYAGEIYDPAADRWTLVAAGAERRIYHSTALLLPDARVLIAGGGHPSDRAHGDLDHFTAEIYSPPYLFRGPRPTIADAPALVRYGETITVATLDAARIADVTWIRLSSVTHAFDQGQRIHRLPFASAGEGTLEVVAPPGPTLAPPGYYLMFLVDEAGVPSVAEMVQVLSAEGAPPAAPESLTARADGDDAVMLEWADRSGDETSFEIEIRSPEIGAYRTLATLPANATEYRAEGLAAGTPYTFRVHARNGAGRSAPSNEASATPEALEGQPCSAGGETLCLLGGRFAVRVAWHDHHNGGHGVGGAIPFPGSDRTGRFWFFDPANVELLVKVLDGRVISEAFWSFYGALSDVEYWITVTDTEGRRNRTYHNPPGTICGVGDTSAFPETEPSPVGGATVAPAPATAPGAVESGSSVAAAPPAVPVARREASARELRGSDAATPGVSTSAGTGGGACVPGPETLCLLDGRLAVEVAWHDQHNGGSGTGQAVPGTEKTGYFWFFNSDNVELAVKALDGTDVNGHLWVFWGALSDVEYTITVTDTATGEPAEYHNPPGEICGGADTAAF